MNEKIIKLTFPFDIESDGIIKTISEIKLTRLKAKHLKLLPKNLGDRDNPNITFDEMLPIIASMSQLTEDQIGEIDWKDLEKVVEVLKSFLPESL